MGEKGIKNEEKDEENFVRTNGIVRGTDNRSISGPSE